MDEARMWAQEGREMRVGSNNEEISILLKSLRSLFIYLPTRRWVRTGKLPALPSTALILSHPLRFSCRKKMPLDP